MKQSNFLIRKMSKESQLPAEDRLGQETFKEIVSFAYISHLIFQSVGGKRVVKFGLVIIIMTVFICVALFPSMELIHVDCTRDYTHEATQKYN
jgi:hypothetical protein